MEHRGSRRRSMLDAMQQVAEEHNLSHSFHGSSEEDDDSEHQHHHVDMRHIYGHHHDDDDDLDDMHDDDDDDHHHNVIYTADPTAAGAGADHPGADTIYEEDGDSTDGDGEAHQASIQLLDPLYEEETESEDPNSPAVGVAVTLKQPPAGGYHDSTTTSSSNNPTDASSFYYYEDDMTNQGSVSSYNDSGTAPDSPPAGYAKRGSFAAMRRSVRSNDSSVNSLPSIPVSTAEEDEDDDDDDFVGHGSDSQHDYSDNNNAGPPPTRRSGSDSLSRTQSKRRSNFYRQSIKAPSSDMAAAAAMAASGGDPSQMNLQQAQQPSQRGRMMLSSRGGPAAAGGGMFASRRASRRSSNRSSFTATSGGDGSSATSGGVSSQGGRAVGSGGGGGPGPGMDIASAVDRLGGGGGGEAMGWDQTIAAAAIVAASTNAPTDGTRRQIRQYSAGEHALVMLNLLNIQNRVDDPDDFSIAPVNEHGYPKNHVHSSHGHKTSNEKYKQGPFHYLICTVTVVHFDEDERYYTVRRGDTNSEQRADPSVMSPIRDEAAIHMAFRAARRTRRTQAEHASLRHGESLHHKRWVEKWCKEWPVHYYKHVLVPAFLRTRAHVKVISTHLLHGDTGYAFKVKLTGINFLVLCSFIYLFNDAFSLSFLSSDWDYHSAIVGLVVWIVLLLELLFEGLIRPANYRELKASDKAYSPSTARHMNTFHLCFESAALFLYLPHFPCVFYRDRCGDDTFFSPIYASLLAVTSEDWYWAAFGRVILGLTFLRVFGLVRHWKQMWLSNVFETDTSNSRIVRRFLLLGSRESRATELRGALLVSAAQRRRRARSRRKKKDDYDESRGGAYDDDDDSLDDEKGQASGSPGSPSKGGGGGSQPSSSSKKAADEDQDLKNAANIGTALMIVNSHRVLVLLLVISVVFPSLYAVQYGNDVNEQLTSLLQANNLMANATVDCDYLYVATHNWLLSLSSVHAMSRYLVGHESDINLVWAQLLPVRCDWQRPDGVITDCDFVDIKDEATCNLWSNSPPPAVASPEYFADTLDRRVGEMQTYEEETTAAFGGTATRFYVKAINDLSNTVAATFRSLFLLQVSMLIVVLLGLTVMRGDAGRLVLDPLQRMLKIVVRYAENPLSQSLSSAAAGRKRSSSNTSRRTAATKNSRGGSTRRNSSSSSAGSLAEQLGSYETDQLINAIAKIADLLRKCWGVAGAGIISSNLARTKDGKTVVFNPTVPGKRVYALFGFVAIREFDMLLRALDRDVMVLINDVARVVHDEVYRWSLGDSGQCNKNLGAAFLMVFRIGDFSEVHDRKKRATDVVFNSNLGGQARRNPKVKKRRGSGSGGSTGMQQRRASYTKFELGSNGTLQLASLPGIQLFTDRALLGLLKSYAGLARDDRIVNWRKDFRLGAGVGAFSVKVIYGMDAGWAVEGAVGSEYKIDATYLSPHVNMASRMMSASKQYGVTILLSQAVEELLSKPAQAKLRHLDTVIVKGSSRPQRIFTYDARAEGTNFFLFDRPGDQADLDAELYSAAVWDSDQDLRAMRQHVSEQFMKLFRRGVDLYLSGEWKLAMQLLKEADNEMLQTVIEEGYMEVDISEFSPDELYNAESADDEVQRLRQHYGDGACKNLISYMERRDGVPPPDWRGFRALMSK